MSVICTTCGRDNPSQLAFCQECGQRLPRAGAAGAAPTPPLGVPPTAAAMGTSPLAATAIAPVSAFAAPVPAAAPAAPLARPGPAAAVRPAAPDVHFTPKGDAPADALLCVHCGMKNQNTVRFCVACGKPLATAAVAPAVVRARGPAIDLSKTVQTPPPVHEPGPGEALAPERVVDLGPPAPVPLRLCPRCRAPSDGAAQFCRTCGASLAQAEGPIMRGSSAQPVAAPVPAVVQAPAAPPAPAIVPVRATAPVATAAARASTPRGAIVLVARDGGEGPAYPLGESTDIGRTEGNILLTDDAYISPRHARISLRGQTYFLRDLGSTNGVYVRLPFLFGGELPGEPAPGQISAEGGVPKNVPRNGAEGEPANLREHPLKDQDLFLVGQQVLRFEVVKGAEEGFGVASDNGTLLFGTPASPRYARLVQRTVEGVTRDVFNLRKTETVLGREGGDIVFTDDPFLSRRHAIIRLDAGSRRFSLADLGSSNGTFVRVHDEVCLQSGDQFRIGQQLFRFDLEHPPIGGTHGAA
jgi:pSer/pThr/pTyr-binding forkhead associated (FHA) protein/predicted amidophosphoribosyltransferase